MPSLVDFDLSALRARVTSLGHPAYRAQQLLEWVYRGASTYDAMPNVPRALKADLAEWAPVRSLQAVASTTSADLRTTKLLFRLHDGAAVEAVRMTGRNADGGERTTICVSSQAGCAYGCKFCATGQGGYGRNLSSGEIVEQALHFLPGKRGTAAAPSITNIVFMGMGEPFANYDSVMRAIGSLNAPWGLGLGARHVTVSTVGLVPEIRRFTEEPVQAGLAVSLHAPADPLRNELMPVNRKYPLKALMAACRHYTRRTSRRVTFEYVLLAGVNDSLEHAAQLANLLRGMLCHVNLIPNNPTPGGAFGRPEPNLMRAFLDLLKRAGIPATLRATQGMEIQAACGQLQTEAQGRNQPVR